MTKMKMIEEWYLLVWKSWEKYRAINIQNVWYSLCKIMVLTFCKVYIQTGIDCT